MMPLALADVGTENLIRKVGGSPEVKKHLGIWALWPAVPPRWWPPWAATSSSR